MNNAQQTTESRTKTLIVGLGKTGLSCARYLTSRGEQVAITDTRAEPPCLEALRAELPDVALFLGGFNRTTFQNADLIVVSPGVPVSTPEIKAARARGIPVIGDIELFARAIQGLPVSVAAITGSNGKSTVTTLLGLMARLSAHKVVLGGNLGEPVLELLAQDAAMYVLELSSFQLETLESLRPKVAAVLNLSPDHMDRYADLDAYAQAKQRILEHAQVAVLNADDPVVAAMPGGAKRLSFTLGEPSDTAQYGVRRSAGSGAATSGLDLMRGEEKLIAASEILMPGAHNRANALAALAMGEVLGLDRDAMLEALRSFPGLAHRTEYIAEIHGLRFYNDSKGTNVGACCAALEGLHDDSGALSVLIAGGDCKGANFEGLRTVLKRCVRGLVLIGRDAPAIAQVLGDEVPTRRAEDMNDAIAKAMELASKGDRVLLSPACASFDMYRNYEHRGEVFAQGVREMLE